MEVLISIDCSKASQCVLDEVVARPWPPSTQFTVLHVVDVSRFEELPALLEDARSEGTALVQGAADQLRGAGLKVSTQLLSGTPRHAIASHAKQFGADLVMVGSHGRGAIARFLLGSVARGVLRTAPCSVEVVRPNGSGAPRSSHPLKILLATDGSEFSAAAAKSVASRPWPAGSAIKMLSVEELPIALPNQWSASSLSAIYPSSLVDELMENARTRAQEARTAAQAILAHSALRLAENGSAPVGDARLVILDQATEWGADLIVLGSHGRRGLDRLLMGSVSESVAIHAHCSVEVIRTAEHVGNGRS